MKKTKRSNKPKRRTSLEIEEEQTRTLYIRLPHTIKNVDEIKSLFFGDFRVKIPRKPGRFCHIIFSDIKEKTKNLKAIKKKLIDGKPVFAGPPRPMKLDKSEIKQKKLKQKKVVIPEPKEEPKLGKYLFISNIPVGVKASEVRDAFPGSLTVGLLKGVANKPRIAKVKMPSSEACLHIAKNKAEWPTLKGQKLHVRLAKKPKGSKSQKLKKKSGPLKIYDVDDEIKNDTSKARTKSNEEKEDVSDENDETESDAHNLSDDDVSDDEDDGDDDNDEEKEEEEEEKEEEESEDEESE